MGADRFDLNSSDLLRLYSFTLSTLHAFGWGFSSFLGVQKDAEVTVQNFNSCVGKKKTGLLE